MRGFSRTTPKFESKSQNSISIFSRFFRERTERNPPYFEYRSRGRKRSNDLEWKKISRIFCGSKTQSFLKRISLDRTVSLSSLDSDFRNDRNESPKVPEKPLGRRKKQVLRPKRVGFLPSLDFSFHPCPPQPRLNETVFPREIRPHSD